MIGLTYVRQVKGLSMEDIANTIGVTKQTISKWESNAKPISEISLDKLSKQLGIDGYILKKEINNSDRQIILLLEYENLK